LGKSDHRNRPDKNHYSGFGLPPIVVKVIRRIACDQKKTTDIRNTLGMPLTAIINAGRSILLRKTSLGLSLNQCHVVLQVVNKFACAKHSFLGPVRKIMPS